MYSAVPFRSFTTAFRVVPARAPGLGPPNFTCVKMSHVQELHQCTLWTSCRLVAPSNWSRCRPSPAQHWQGKRIYRGRRRWRKEHSEVYHTDALFCRLTWTGSSKERGGLYATPDTYSIADVPIVDTSASQIFLEFKFLSCTYTAHSMLYHYGDWRAKRSCD